MLSLKGLKFISYRFILFSIFFFFLLNAFLSLDLTERFEFGNDTPLKADKKNVQDVGESISGSNELNTSLIAELSIQSFLDKVKSLEIYYKASYILYLESLLPKNIRSAENVDLWQVAANFGHLQLSTLETFIKQTHTLKRNPKMELSKPDLLKLLSYLEGELQARDIVIATLKCEKMKYMLKYGPPKSASLSDPVAALCRDNFAVQSSSSDLLADYEHQPNPLEVLVTQQRRSLVYMAKLFKDAEQRHQKVIEELMLAPKKEIPKASRDVLLNGLIDDPSQLKQDVDPDGQCSKRFEGDLKMPDASSDDKARLKQIVLLLLAERKKIVMKYIEERKRSEDLAQILSEEKSRINSMAEGLEEESKKSLQMEAELEKQIAHFDAESLALKGHLMKEEKKVKELEGELERARSEISMLEKQLNDMQQSGVGNTGTVRLSGAGGTLVSSLAKVVQPTATVSSVPVAGPTTGVARGVPAAGTIRGIAYAPSANSNQPALPRVDKRPTVSLVNPLGKPSPSNSFQIPLLGANGSTEKKPITPRGVPPPVPPNKPILPPKKDSVFKRPDIALANMDASKLKKEQKPGDSSESHSETYSNVKSE